MQFAHVAQRSRGDPFAGAAGGFTGIGGGGHLRGHAGFARGLHHQTQLVHGSRKGFDTTDVFAAAQRGQNDERMRVIRCAAIDRVDLVALSGQHLPEIAVAPGLGPVVVGLLGVGIVHVAQGDDLKTGLGALLQLAEAHAAHAHTGEREPRIG